MRVRPNSAVSEALLQSDQRLSRVRSQNFWFSFQVGSLVLVCLGSGCGDGRARSPFVGGGTAGMGLGAGGGTGGAQLLGSGGSAQVGGACVDDGQCDDSISCTLDSCDLALGRCRFTPDPSRCQDEVYCNGGEVCEPRLGCRPGVPVHCSDKSTCTIDRCVEETGTCEHLPRDADGDQDPVWNCGGTDCNDLDPLVNGNKAETCGNAQDDDCDQQTDEEECILPEHDTCADALLVEASGSYALSLRAAREDIALSCVSASKTRRDVVVALTVPEGEALDLDLRVVSDDPGLGLALLTACGIRGIELDCSAAAPLSNSGSGVARLALHAVNPGVYPLYVSGTADGELRLDVSYAPATDAPSNETCGNALDLPEGESVVARVVSADTDLRSACGIERDLVYRFQLAQASDVTLSAVPLDDFGDPVLSLRSEACTSLGSELDCRTGLPARLFRRALEPGTYFAAIGASGPSSFDLRLDVSPKSTAPATQGCSNPPELTFGATVELDLQSHTNAIASSCLPGAVDATFGIFLPERSDVLLLERMSEADEGAIALFAADCDASRAFVCSASTSPVRTRAFGLPAGTYRAVAESRVGNPIAVTAFQRKAAANTLVPFADTCDEAVQIPEGGGRFSGNTSNVDADYAASCDFGGVTGGGAPEQMLKLSLQRLSRVVLDLAGSDFATLLVVRSATDCPGEELPLGCAPGRGRGRSFLDLELPAGDYFIQIDGYSQASGHWLLDVYEAPL